MASAAATWERLAALPLRVEEPAGRTVPELVVPSGWARKTTVVSLRGAGEEGRGEDVVYEAEEHEALEGREPLVDLTGAATLGEACALIARADLFPAGDPDHDVSRRYRRWAWESAALDLALRQSGIGLGELLGREAQPTRFVSSAGLGAPPSADALLPYVGASPGIGFKLDASQDWDGPLLGRLAALGTVACVDMKAYYTGTRVDTDLPAELVLQIAEALPEATLEDVDPGDATALLVEHGHADRLAWDAPIHEVADIDALPVRPRRMNVKPSRIGSIEELLAVYERLEDDGIAMYGGGQFELSVGRGQILHLASLMHPGGANDCAPVAFHPVPGPGTTLPVSPLAPPSVGPGLRWTGPDGA